jgi:hypothetical protein
MKPFRLRSAMALALCLVCGDAWAEDCPPGDKKAETAASLPKPTETSKPARKKVRKKKPRKAAQAAPPSAAELAAAAARRELGDRRELLVVGVYRPVEMSGRTVKVDREVFLQPVDGKGDKVGDLVGRRMTVHRRAKVPVSVEAPVAAPPASAPAAASSASSPPPSAPPSAPVTAAPSAAPQKLTAVERLRALRAAAQGGKAPASAPPPPSKAPASAPASAPPPSSKAPASAPASAPPVVASTPAAPRPDPFDARRLQIQLGGKPDADGVARQTPRPVPGPPIETEVGQIEVFEIRNGIAVARVVTDALAQGRPVIPGADLPVVSSGDVARFTIPAPIPPPPPPPEPPPPLSAEERARLDAENERARAEDYRRKNPRGKYERKVMRWKL